MRRSLSMVEVSDDILDEEYEPSVEPKSSKAWLNLITDAEKVFDDYQHKADSIDKQYASLDRLSKAARDREFQLFWANVQVLAPSIYSRPPVPVVVPKFKDRRPIYRLSSELLERCSIVAFDLTDIDSVMIQLRDDLAIQARGVPWVRYETKEDSDSETEKVCIEHKDRRDFLHDPARKWAEVGWVAGAGYLTKQEMGKRFRKISGNAYKEAAYAVQKEAREVGGADNREKAKVWEIWSKTENKVVWVTEGVDVLLDEDKPHLKLEGFFPCPKPAYATTQRGSLIPVPDMVYYKDQLEEINDLTSRIHALAEAIQVKGFYPSGGEIGEAIETALKLNNDSQIMIPVSNFAAFGGNGGDPIVWLPIDQIATTLQGIIELRRQVIDDVYQIMGLSDIMRGSTEKEETLGAQQLKAQFGSVRVRDKQSELVRVARDCVRIAAEIMAENFSSKTLLQMSQMEIPTDADIAKQLKALTDQAEQIKKSANEQLEQAQQDPQMMAQAQANPEQAQQMIQQLQQQTQQQLDGLKEQAKKLQETVTIEQVMKFLRDQKIRPFVLDIETDSTIAPDEQAEKESRNEFMTALGSMLQQFLPMLQMMPQAAGMVGEMIKFALAPYRAGRELEGKIDEAIEQIIAQAQQPQPNPEAEAQKAEQVMEQQRMQFEMQKFQAEQQGKQQEAAMKAQAEQVKAQAEREDRDMERQFKTQEAGAKMQVIQATMQRDEQKGALEMRKLQMEIEAKQAELHMKAQAAQIDAAVQVQNAEIQASSAAQQASQSERSFEQQSALAKQKAAQASNGPTRR